MDAQPKLETYGHALLMVRRALTQSLESLPAADLWRAREPHGRAIGDVVRAAGAAEAYWLWPPQRPLPELEERPNRAGLLYALARYRVVTDELLLDARDADLERIHLSAARQGDGAEPRPLGWILRTLMRDELDHTAEIQALRRLWQPHWSGARAAWELGVRLVSECP